MRSSSPCPTAVPDRFVHGQITDTVLGTLHLAMCNAATRHTLGVLFDVFDGTLQCTLRTTPGSLSTPVPCDAELAAAGVTVRRELSGCRLSTMECGINPEEEIAAIEATDASFVRVHLERLNISLASGARLSFVRDLIERPGATFVAQARPFLPWRSPKMHRLLPMSGSPLSAPPPSVSCVPASLTARGSSRGRMRCGRAK